MTKHMAGAKAKYCLEWTDRLWDEVSSLLITVERPEHRQLCADIRRALASLHDGLAYDVDRGSK